MHHEYKISIITINYNGIKDTCELIQSLPFNDYQLEVIVVDNASSNDEASELSSIFPQIKVIRSDKNTGFAGGNNLGIQAASGDFLFFINNDTILPPHTNLDAMVTRLRSDSSIGIICPKICYAWSNGLIQYAGYTALSNITIRNHAIGHGEEDHGQYNYAHPTPYAHGAAMMVKREAIEIAGKMPECYFLYYEELDWSLIMRRAGFSIWYDPCCTVLHKESKSTGINSPAKAYYITRNRLLFVKRNVFGAIKYLSLGYLIGIVCPKDCLKYLFRGQVKHINANIKGIVDFLKM